MDTFIGAADLQEILLPLSKRDTIKSGILVSRNTHQNCNYPEILLLSAAVAREEEDRRKSKKRSPVVNHFDLRALEDKIR